jgi:hypothetical protein
VEYTQLTPISDKMAADEHARAARRAGLQAKKDEQPANTARSYAAKQREWKARSPGRRPLFSPLPLSLFFYVESHMRLIDENL